MKNAVNQIVSNFSKSSEIIIVTKKKSKWKKIRKPKVFVPMLIVIAIIIILSIALPILIGSGDNGGDLNDSLSNTPEHSTSSTDSSTQQSTMAVSSSTETALPVAKVVKRDAWMMEGFDVNGKFKQLQPIKRILILKTETETETCTNESSCIDFMFEHQQNSYPEFDDIRENFLISLDGTIYEGRGLLREGQTTNDGFTSYNSQALSISFLASENENLSELQQNAFCLFIDEMIADDILDRNFLTFQHGKLISSFFDFQSEISIEKCEIILVKRKKHF